MLIRCAITLVICDEAGFLKDITTKTKIFIGLSILAGGILISIVLILLRKVCAFVVCKFLS